MAIPHVNRVTLLGTVQGDVEGFTDSRDQPFVLLRLATTKEWTVKSTGETRSIRDVHRVLIFNQTLADVAMRTARHGSVVLLEGELRVKPRADRVAVEIELGHVGARFIVFDAQNAPGAGDVPASAESVVA